MTGKWVKKRERERTVGVGHVGVLWIPSAPGLLVINKGPHLGVAIILLTAKAT